MRNQYKYILIVVAVLFAVATGNFIVGKVFSSSKGGRATPQQNRIPQSSPPQLIDDPNDITYWPSIDELQWFAQTKRDGFFRKISQDDYEARRWDWYCNSAAKDTWPKGGR